MIIVKMRQNNIIHRIGGDAKISQSLNWALNEITLALDRHFGGKAGINHHNMIIGLGQPNKIIHWHGAIMRVTTNKMFASYRIAGGIANGIKLINGKIE